MIGIIGSASPFSETEKDDSILNLEVSDDALERAAGTQTQIVTIGYCTNFWYYCDWQ